LSLDFPGLLHLQRDLQQNFPAWLWCSRPEAKHSALAAFAARFAASRLPCRCLAGSLRNEKRTYGSAARPLQGNPFRLVLAGIAAARRFAPPETIDTGEKESY